MKFSDEESMGWREFIILLMVLCLVFLVYRCNGDPDKTCDDICRINGLNPGVRVHGFFQQDCSNCGPPIKKQKVKINLP